MQNSPKNPSEQSSTRSEIGRIVRLGSDAARAYVPPLSDYSDVSPGWSEAEYRAYETDTNKVTVGYWTGDAGHISLESWPYTEVCSIVSGRIALRDDRGRELVFGAGDGFVVPKGWAGVWVTLEPSAKFFVMIA